MKHLATFEVLKGTKFVGFVKASSHPAALRKAVALYGPFVDVELPTRCKKQFGDYMSANACQQRKQSRRYPVGDFEARRKALIAVVLGN